MKLANVELWFLKTEFTWTKIKVNDETSTAYMKATKSHPEELPKVMKAAPDLQHWQNTQNISITRSLEKTDSTPQGILWKVWGLNEGSDCRCGENGKRTRNKDWRWGSTACISWSAFNKCGLTFDSWASKIILEMIHTINKDPMSTVEMTTKNF